MLGFLCFARLVTIVQNAFAVTKALSSISIAARDISRMSCFETSLITASNQKCGLHIKVILIGTAQY